MSDLSDLYNKYPKWAVDEAVAMINEEAGDLEELEITVRAVVSVTEAMKRTVPADPNGPGYASSIRILIVPSSWRKKNHD